MPLTSGTKLGPYEILSLLGAGGMGEVYRARDPRLGRDVAIKVLPTERVADADRRRRFVKEARAASALNHPNIVTIHEIESADGIDFIVMEHVLGKTLDELIPRQGMRLGEALRVAIPVSDALSAAHAAGIVHRDLKPTNVMIGTSGAVKVLDFGLAKLVALEGSSDEKETYTWNSDSDRLSRSGTIAGTPPYMSPEQVTGGPVDARSDVFAFGSLLYEMVTGRRAFARTSVVDTLAAVIHEQPMPPSEIVSDLPRDLEKLILRCLRKQPERRFQHMGDVKVQLLELKEETDSDPAAAMAPARVDWRWRLGALVAGMAILAGAVWQFRQNRRASFFEPRVQLLTALAGWEANPTFSPDGTQVAFRWASDDWGHSNIWVKLVGSSEMRQLTSGPGKDDFPSWSPDGGLVAFARYLDGDAASTIHLVSSLGGSDRRLSDLPIDGALSWSPDGQWLAVGRTRGENETAPEAGGLYLVPSKGGVPRLLTSPQVPAHDTVPAFSWDGRHLAFASCTGSQGQGMCDVSVMEFGPDYKPSGAPRRVSQQPVEILGLAWTRDDRSLVYSEIVNARLWRLGVDGDRPAERIFVGGFSVSGGPAIARSQARLAFVEGRNDTDIVRFERGRPAQPVATSSTFEVDPQFSPDGRRIAFASPRSGDAEIWLADADGSNPVQLTRGPRGGRSLSPSWSPDGRRIAFESRGENLLSGIWTIDVDGGSLTRLTEGRDDDLPSWSADGHWVYFSSERGGSGRVDVWRVPSVGGPAEPVTRHGGTLPQESADGRKLLFMRGSFDSELFALPLGGGPERRVIECVPYQGYAVGRAGIYHLGCTEERELPLFLMDVATGRDVLLGRLEKPYRRLTVSPDGKTILYAKTVIEGSDLMLIENFQ